MEWFNNLSSEEIRQLISTISVVFSCIVISITAYFTYKKIKVHARQNTYMAVKDMVDFMKSFSDIRGEAFQKSDINIVVTNDQFPKSPPKRHAKTLLSDGQFRRASLTSEQEQAYQNCPDEVKNLYRKIINNLNDIGQLLEDGFIPKRMFYGMYHIAIIRCVHLVETYRRKMEGARGGNYGQRVLRMRHDAVTYHKVIPKHRDVTISVSCNGSEKEIVDIKSNFFQRYIVFPVIKRNRFPN